MRNSISQLLEDFMAVFFPKTCAACQHVLVSQEQYLCTSCLYHLPFSNFHRDAHNPTVAQLQGKFSFQYATSMLLLRPDSAVEQLLYQIKYANHPELAFYLGECYGKRLVKDQFLLDVDAIVPIPLHRSKLKKRGYNQALHFAQGLGVAMQKVVIDDALVRLIATKSQTKLSRLERHDNVSNVFSCINVKQVRGKHILLVDDVLTTGATLTAAAEQLLLAGAHISVLTLARA